MLGDLGVDRLPPMCLEAREGPFLVRTYEPAVTHDVRGKTADSLRSTRSVAEAALTNRMGRRDYRLTAILTLRAAAGTTFRRPFAAAEIRAKFDDLAEVVDELAQLLRRHGCPILKSGD